MVSYQRSRSRLRRTSLSGLIIVPLLLVGCTSTPHPQVTAKPAVSKNATSPQSLGDAVVTGQTVTDELGKYETVKINPKSAALTVQDYLVDQQGMTKAGFTMAQVADAQRWLVSFIASEGLDSVAVDRGSKGWADWQQTAGAYIDPARKADVFASIKGIDDRAQVILNDDNNKMPQLLRDGGPRVVSEQIKVSQVQFGYLDDKTKTPYIMFGGNANAVYRATNTAIIKAQVAAAPGLTVNSLKKAYKVFANKDQTDVQVENTLMYAYTLTLIDGQWRIAAINNRTSVGYVGLTD